MHVLFAPPPVSDQLRCQEANMTVQIELGKRRIGADLALFKYGVFSSVSAVFPLKRLRLILS